jgi:hypothetical protein
VPRSRTTARSLLALLVAGFFAGTANATVPIAFPVVGNVTFENDYGASRPNGWHQGIDILARRHAPAIAAERGWVDIHYRSLASTCMLYLHGASGYTWVYIHLNNDLTMGNDNDGGCREGVAYVRKGELVGYVGDSGDADGGQPHLHFEKRKRGSPLNPYWDLRAAPHALYPRPAALTEISLRLAGRVQTVTADRIGITVRVITMSNGWYFYYTRNVTLALSPSTIYDHRTSSGALLPSSLADVQPGQRVRVWTTTFSPSWRTQVAAPGVLSAKRVRTRD